MVWGSSEPKPKVAYLGPVASYSHKVRGRNVNKIPSLSYYDLFDRPKWAFGLTDGVLAQATMGCFSANEFEYVPCTHIKDIFDAVQSGSCFRGIVPFENSTNGFVVFTLDLLADRERSYPDITVYDETYVDVHHYLLGNLPPSHDSTPTLSSSSFDSSRSEAQDSGTCTPTLRDPHPREPHSKPLTDISHITKLYSHPQAFGQCEPFLQRFLKGVERIDVSSTSQAAEIAKADKTGRSAAISSKAASEVHKVNVLARGIEEKTDNCTRFLVIKKNDAEDREYAFTAKSPINDSSADVKESNAATSSLEKHEQVGSSKKSLVSLTVDHRSPGALADVLQCFRRAELNLTSINSRPSKAIPFQYIFFIEFEGSRIEDPGGRVEGALGEVAEVATGWRWLGSWQNRLNRSDDLS